MKDKGGLLVVEVSVAVVMTGALCGACLVFTGKVCGSLEDLAGLILLEGRGELIEVDNMTGVALSVAGI